MNLRRIVAKVKTFQLDKSPLLMLLLSAWLVFAFYVTIRAVSRQKVPLLSSTNLGHVTNSTVKLVVVEEHHEVLPYWLEAARVDIIPKNGNILVHIDGHSDDGPPDFNEDNYPLYRRPKNRKELRPMLQRNDVFIQSAIGAGLFKRFIWIWPSWDTEKHDEDYVIYRVEYGHMHKEGVMYLCHCRHLLDHSDNECLYMDLDAAPNNETIPIPRGKCVIKGEYLYEEAREDVARARLQDADWIKPEETVVLDIDEDFFGCESAGMPLINAGLNWTDVQTINKIVDILICPRKTVEENPAEDFLMEVVKEFLSKCQQEELTCQSHEASVSQKAEALMSKIFSEKKEKRSFLCKESLAVLQERMRVFVQLLSRLTRAQLLTVAKAGFCFMTTPKSLLFDVMKTQGIGTYKICTGFNSPGDAIVTYFSPSDTDMKRRIRTLRSIVTHGKYPDPKLITVCRSVRDGYTPRSRFETIEHSIIKAMKDRMGATKVTVRYDKDLLGGKYGWPPRHRPENF